MKAKKMKLVSIIISCYNAQDFISETINSLLHQVYRNFEIIIVDDGSTDETCSILQRLSQQDERIRIIPTQHIGASAAKNIGLAQCRGEYIAISDADDLSYCRRLQAQVEYLNLHPQIGLIGTNYDYINAKGEIYNSFDYSQIRQQGNFSDYLKQELYQCRNPFLHSSVMFRKSLLTQVSGYDESFRAALDYDFILRISEFTEIDIFPEFLAAWRKHDTQITFHRFLEQQENTFISVIRHLQKLIREGVNPNEIDQWLLYLKAANEHKAAFEKKREKGVVEKQHLYNEACLQFHVQKNYAKAGGLFKELLNKRGRTINDFKACAYFLACALKINS